MKHFIISLAFMPMCSWAQPLSLNFHEIPVVAFAEATYKSILGKDLIIAPDVIGIDSKVTILVKAVDKAKLPKLLADVLQSVGVVAREVDGLIKLERVVNVAAQTAVANDASKKTVLALEPQPIEPNDYEVYRPQYRTVDYLQVALRSAGLALGTGAAAPTTAQSSSLDALIISGNDARRKTIRSLIEKLDQRPHVVNVRAALVEFTESNNESWSIGGVLSILNDKLGITANATNSSTNFSRLKTGGIDVVFGAMSGDSRFRFLTRPSIRLVDGEQGRMQVGSDVPVRGALTVTQSGQQVQATDYKASGLVLAVLPRIFKDRVQAKVLQEISSFAQTTSSGIDSPTLNKRLIETVVDVEDGEVVVLAGLDEENVTDSRSGLFSWLTLAKGSTNRKTQLFVLLEFKRL
jgi:general secretion pathway protein D